jgi:hypothetical protein
MNGDTSRRTHVGRQLPTHHPLTCCLLPQRPSTEERSTTIRTRESEGPHELVPRVAILFRDCNGVRWMRDFGGRVTRVRGDSNSDPHRPPLHQGTTDRLNYWLDDERGTTGNPWAPTDDGSEAPAVFDDDGEASAMFDDGGEAPMA